MIWTKILENVIKTKKLRYLIVFHDMISEILSKTSGDSNNCLLEVEN